MSGFDSTLASLGISRSGVSTAPEVKTAAASQMLDQGDFLALLTAQLKNQDPFEPVKNEDMVAQMATFSSSAGISEMNATLKTLVGRMDAQGSAQAISYVSKTVLVAGDTAYPHSSGGLDAVVDLDAAASDVGVMISDGAGNVLRTLSLGPQKAGEVKFSWDGKTDAGGDAGEGPFRIAATSISEGTPTPATVLVWAPVTSVSMPPDGSAPQLNVAGLGAKPITAVRQVG